MAQFPFNVHVYMSLKLARYVLAGSVVFTLHGYFLHATCTWEQYEIIHRTSSCADADRDRSMNRRL